MSANRKLRRAQERDTQRYNALMLDRIGKAFERVAVRNHSATYRELYTRFLDANRGSWEEFGLKAEVLRGEPKHKRWFAHRYRHNWPLRVRRFFFGLGLKVRRALSTFHFPLSTRHSMITFVYPWINPGGYAEKELRMSLRSLEENVLGDYRAFIIGDCPATLADIVYVKHDRTLTGPHAKCVDAVRKLELAIATPQIGEHFVYMADDIALLQPFHPNDLAAMPVALYEVIDGNVLLNKINDALVQRTVNALRERGLKRVWYYETHMPRLFEKRKLQEIISLYKPAENGLMIPTLYFNHFWPEQEPIILHKADNILARCTGRESDTTFGPRPGNAAQVKAYYLNTFKGKRYLNWNDDAISQGFVDALLSLFPAKATHETSTTAYLTE